jgi:hypothetical protein
MAVHVYIHIYVPVLAVAGNVIAVPMKNRAIATVAWKLA